MGTVFGVLLLNLYTVSISFGLCIGIFCISRVMLAGFYVSFCNLENWVFFIVVDNKEQKREAHGICLRYYGFWGRGSGCC